MFYRSTLFPPKWITIMKRLLLCSLALTSCLLSTLAGAETVYKWVDDEGVTHFTAHPPKNRKSDAMRTSTGRSEPIDYSKQFPQEGSNNAQSNVAESPRGAPSQEELDEACRRARENLKMIEEGRRIAVTDDNGEQRYLDQQEIDQRAEQARQIRDRAC